MGNLFSSDVGYNSTTTAATSYLHRTINGIIQETYTKNVIEDRIAADAIPVDELIADYAEARDTHSKAFGILRSTSGITSVISSSIFIWMIMRSHDRLSTTQHRLLFGLCICDIILSLSKSTFNAVAPSDNDYMTWNATGNQATCTAMGFLVTLGAAGGLFYNTSLNLYFLAVVKYNKNNEFIRAKIEPFLHGVPIAVAISFSTYKLVKKHYNDDGNGSCNLTINDAPHCVGYDVGEIRDGFEIPCWRGIDGHWTAAITSMVLMLLPVLIIIVSLCMIYSSVRTQEKKLARYGVGSLRLNLQQQSIRTPQSSGTWGRLSMSVTALSTSLKAGKWSWRNSHKSVTRSNNVQSQSRAVMHKAFGYTFAWFLSWGFWLIGTITEMATGSFPLVLYYLANIFVPLQGLFNLLIFMHPKIVAAKKSKKRGGGETVSWCQAFSTAFWSRGKEGNNQGTNRSNLRGGTNNRHQKKKTKFWSRGKGGSNQGTNRSNLRGHTSNRHQKKKTRNKDAASGNVRSPMFDRMKKKTKRANTTSEEEKCEIQMPDHLIPHKSKAMYSATSTATYAPNIVPSTDTTTMRTVFDLDENANVGTVLSDVVDVLVEDPDEDVMLNQDEEEQIEEAEEENVSIVSMAADGLASADLNEQKEHAMENQDAKEDAMKMDDDSELARG